MAPELLHTIEADELRDLAQRIRDWQQAQKPALSDNALLKKLPQLGSTKTFTRILANDLRELDLERQLANYRQASAFIESLGDLRDRDTEEIYDDLTTVGELRRAYLDVARESSDGRVIFLLGPSGSGKTFARRALMERFGARLLLTEASVAWSDSPMAMLGQILTALGCREHPVLQIERLAKVVELLKETRRCVIIEESHHLGPRCLDLVKTLINQTPGEFLLIGIDTLWRRLETKAYEQARQLTGNRLAERINIQRELKERDARIMLTRRLGVTLDTPWHPALRLLLERAPGYGRLAFIREVIRRVQVSCEDCAPTPEALTAAINEEVKSR